MTSFIQQWSVLGQLALPGREPVLAPGVRGFAFDRPEGVYIAHLFAETEGNGDVGRFLDQLPTDRRIVFPTVIHPKLRAMLSRRGFVDAVEHDDVDVMVRAPT